MRNRKLPFVAAREWQEGTGALHDRPDFKGPWHHHCRIDEGHIIVDMKSETHTSPEFDRFYRTLKALVAVPQSEIKIEMEKYKKERAAKKKKRDSAKRSQG